jgi:hypothetical protein
MRERLKQMIKDANDAKDALIRWKDSQDINDEVFLLSLNKYITETFVDRIKKNPLQGPIEYSFYMQSIESKLQKRLEDRTNG